MPYKDPEVRKAESAKRFKEWAERNPEKANLRMKDWRHRNPKYMLRAAAKRRAKEKGLEFNLSLDDIPDIPAFCPISGIPLFPRDDGGRGPCDNSPSLDRVRGEFGYIPGNVRVISHRGNRWKGEMSIADVESLLRYMKEH